MESAEKIKLLKANLFFQGLPDDQIILIANIAHEKNYLVGDLLIEQGQAESNVYLIIKGLVKVYRISEEGKEVTITLRHSGEIVGEMSFIDERPRSAFVEAIQKTEVLVLPGLNFKELLLNNPDLTLSLLKELSIRLRENNAKFEQLSDNLAERVLKILKTLSQYFPEKSVPLSQEELASLVNASRARVTEALHELVNQNKIILDHKKITPK